MNHVKGKQCDWVQPLMAGQILQKKKKPQPPQPPVWSKVVKEEGTSTSQNNLMVLHLLSTYLLSFVLVHDVQDNLLCLLFQRLVLSSTGGAG